MRYSVLFGLIAAGIAAAFIACDSGTTASINPELSVANHFLVDGRVNINKAAIDRPGWVSVWLKEETPPKLLGKQRISAGQQKNVEVEVDRQFIEEHDHDKISRLQARLHYDQDQEGVFETEIDPIVEGEERKVAPSFFLFHTTAIPESYIVVSDQEIERRTIVIEEIKASEPCDVVIHRDKGNLPLVPGIIGKTRVGKGVNTNVKVELFEYEDVQCGERLWPMLHARTESSDQPYDIDQPIITTSFVNVCNST